MALPVAGSRRRHRQQTAANGKFELEPDCWCSAAPRSQAQPLLSRLLYSWRAAALIFLSYITDAHSLSSAGSPIHSCALQSAGLSSRSSVGSYTALTVSVPDDIAGVAGVNTFLHATSLPHLCRAAVRGGEGHGESEQDACSHHGSAGLTTLASFGGYVSWRLRAAKSD